LKEFSVSHIFDSSRLIGHSRFVLAINKPPSISSAQVIRNLQEHFNPSTFFAPWLAAERAFRDEEQRYQRGRRKDKRVQVKIGHGGTLDPMATGVLIMGVGRGTKQLQGFLECTKTYEATALFGAATDTYDVLGKVLRRGDHKHLTREKVENALLKFRGKIMQRPPIYSALRVQGKRLYEYAREGKEVPKEIEKRPVEVKELDIVEWMEGGSHKHKWPKEEAEEEAKDLAEKVLHLGDVTVGSASIEASSARGAKRKRYLDSGDDESISCKRPNLEDQGNDPEALMSGGLPAPSDSPIEPRASADASSNSERAPAEPALPAQDQGPPAVKLRMTVTSGFYVRSLSHDLGEAVGSLACMSELVRLRQGEFELGKNVLDYEELEKGEKVWAPQLERFLEQWEQRSDDFSISEKKDQD